MELRIRWAICWAKQNFAVVPCTTEANKLCLFIRSVWRHHLGVKTNKFNWIWLLPWKIHYLLPHQQRASKWKTYCTWAPQMKQSKHEAHKWHIGNWSFIWKERSNVHHSSTSTYAIKIHQHFCEFDIFREENIVVLNREIPQIPIPHMLMSDREQTHVFEALRIRTNKCHKGEQWEKQGGLQHSCLLLDYTREKESSFWS